MAAPTHARPVTGLWWWEVPWICGTIAGFRLVRAPHARSAKHDLEQHPADDGLPHEALIVGRAVQLSSRA